MGPASFTRHIDYIDLVVLKLRFERVQVIWMVASMSNVGTLNNQIMQQLASSRLRILN